MRTLCSLMLLLSLVVWESRAKEFAYPIVGTKKLHSASFGELRENHFHSGIDIKTEGEEGKPIVAIADGYVTRIVMSSNGYGRALCVYHPKLRKMSVYGHMLLFREDIEQYLFAEQCRRKSNKITLYPKAGEFPVKQGDKIGLSGNSGMSFGAHLHFELRDASGERVYNIVRQGFMQPVDNVRPQLLRLHRIEVDTVEGVAVERLVATYDIRRNRGQHTINKEVKIGRNGYFVIECRDRHNGTINRYGVYRTTLYVDGKRVFERRMDSFTFAESRYCNTIGYYPMLNGSNCEVLRLARTQSVPSHLFKYLRDDGRVVAEVGQRRHIRIEVEDDSGNMSHIEFDARGAALRVDYQKQSGEQSVKCGEQCLISNGDVTAFLNENTLYETSFCKVERLDETVDIESVAVLSSPYRVCCGTGPLRGNVNIAWRISVLPHLQRGLALARRNHKGIFKYAGGIFWGSHITLQSRSAGDYVVVADTVCPTIKPPKRGSIKGSKGAEYRFEVGDNFSGIRRYGCCVDGEWYPIEYRPVEGTLILRADRSLKRSIAGADVELWVEDGCRNMCRWQGSLP